MIDDHNDDHDDDAKYDDADQNLYICSMEVK